MEHAYQVILVSPEMCLEHDGFWQLLKLPDFTGTLIGIIVDEAHCIMQWGGEFCTSYDKLANLRSYISVDIPFLATSATLAPTALQQVRENLQIHPTKSFFVNLGNDRPNITPSVTKIKSQRDYSSLLDLVATGVLGPSDLSKMIIFTNSIQKTHEICANTYQGLVENILRIFMHFGVHVQSGKQWRSSEMVTSKYWLLQKLLEWWVHDCTFMNLHTKELARVLTYQMLYLLFSLVFHRHWKSGPSKQAVLEECQICKHELCSWLSDQCFNKESCHPKRRNLMVWMIEIRVHQTVQRRVTTTLKR